MFSDLYIDFGILRNILDILFVTFLAYRLLIMIRGTRAAPMLGGLSFLILLYFLAQPFGFVTLGWILNNFLSSIILIVVVVFQDEIRKGLTKVGIQPIFGRGVRPVMEKTLEEITLACLKLSRLKVGALIVIQREVGLDDLVQESIMIDAQMSRKLLFSIFVKDSSLHDGAIVIDGNRIKAAGCVLPLSSNPDLDPNLGTRHRAALGLSERCDAIVVVVSEENGAISLVREGKITRNLEASMLRDGLHRLISTQSDDIGGEQV